MEQNQNQNRNQDQHRVTTQGQQAENPGKKPEVENPQPVRKVEEPVTAAAQNTNQNWEGNSNMKGNKKPQNSNASQGGFAANKDYQHSDVGFKPDEGQGNKRGTDQRESTMSQDDNDAWRDQQQKTTNK